jgi:hypothetical protein
VSWLRVALLTPDPLNLIQVILAKGRLAGISPGFSDIDQTYDREQQFF